MLDMLSQRASRQRPDCNVYSTMRPMGSALSSQIMRRWRIR